MRVWLGGALSLVAMTADAAALRDFRLTQGPESTRVVLDLGKPGSYNVFTLANPDRVVIDLPSVQKPGDVLKLPARQSLVKGVRSGPHDGGLRVVLDTASAVTPKAFGMPPAGGYGYRLIVDLMPPIASVAPAMMAVASSPATATTSNSTAAAAMPTATATTAASAATVAAGSSATAATPSNSAVVPVGPSQAPSTPGPSATVVAGSGTVVSSSSTAVANASSSLPAAVPPAFVAPAAPAAAPTAVVSTPAVATVAPASAAAMDKPASRASSAVTARPSTALRAKPIVVAVDAGHGGEDPGAHGPHGLLEKDVTLSVARKLARLIDAQPGMHAVLTRDSDAYVGLRERTIKARDAQADLFVSVHCNALRDSHMRGTAVYVLSDHGATNEQARWLANRENAADLVGGVDLHDKDNQVAAVLIDISQTATMEASFDLGNRMLDSLAHINVLQKPKVQQAGFMVLKSPDIPSVLVETAFITNDREERLLGNSSYQDKLASSLLEGIRGYFSHYRPQQQIVADDDNDSDRPRAIPVSMASASASGGSTLRTSSLRGN